jgi:hypothetical protein
VAVQVLAGTVVSHGGARVGVAGGDLDIAQVDASVEHGGDKSVPQHMRMCPGDLDAACLKQIEVSNFVISVHQGVLTAEANGNPKVRVPLFQLSLDPRHDPRGTALRADQRDRRYPHRNRSQRPGHHLRHHPVHAGPGNRHRQHAPAVLIRRRPSRRQQHQPWHPVW